LPGFKTYESRGIPLGAAQNVRRTYTLEVGAVTDSVTITGEAPLVNTLSTEQRMSLETVEVKNLPMINRNITNILDINSGLTRGEANFTGMAGTRFRLNGLGGSAMNVTANGTDANGNAGSMVISGYGQYNKIEVMSAEAVAEVQIVKGVIPAEYGSAMAGTMSVISKSGTNEWHGSIFHRYEGSVLSARQPFLAHEANSVWNQFGGSLGGPILRDKLFFFVAYEGYRQRTTIALPNAASVPTQRFRDIMMTSLRFPETKLFLDHLPLPNQPHATDALLGLWVGGTLKTE
jgi:outer membrane receptor for ferrienterochelin and colicin